MKDLYTTMENLINQTVSLIDGRNKRAFYNLTSSTSDPVILSSEKSGKYKVRFNGTGNTEYIEMTLYGSQYWWAQSATLTTEMLNMQNITCYYCSDVELTPSIIGTNGYLNWYLMGVEAKDIEHGTSVLVKDLKIPSKIIRSIYRNKL